MFRALAGRKIRNEAEVRAYIDAVYPPPKIAAAKTLGAGAQPPRKAETLADLLSGKAAIDDNVASYRGKAPMLAEQAPVEAQTRLIHDEVIELFQHGKGNDAPGVKGTAWRSTTASLSTGPGIAGRTGTFVNLAGLNAPGWYSPRAMCFLQCLP